MKVKTRNGTVVFEMSDHKGQMTEVSRPRKRLVIDNIDKTVSVVSHGGTIKVLICLVLGLSPLSHWQFSIDQSSLSQIMLLPEGATVDYINDTSFLKKVKRQKIPGI